KRTDTPCHLATAVPSSCCYRCTAPLLDLDLDRLGLGLFPLGQRHDQDAVRVACLHCLGIDMSGQLEAAYERAVPSLIQLIGPGLGFGLVLALAAQGEDAVLDLHVQIARLEPRHIGAELDSVCRFDHVYGGRPARRCWSGGPEEIMEQLIY